MKMKFRKNWWMWLIVGVLCCAMLGGIIYAIVVATDDGKVKTKTISASEFSLGGLDENGKYVETKESIYTKDAFQCQGLTVTPEFESQIKYQIFFYNLYGEFLSKTDSLSKSYTGDVPSLATYARIVITPNKVDNEALQLNVFKVSKYAKQLTIKVNKEQKAGADYFKTTMEDGSDLFVYGSFDMIKFETGEYTSELVKGSGISSGSIVKVISDSALCVTGGETITLNTKSFDGLKVSVFEFSDCPLTLDNASGMKFNSWITDSYKLSENTKYVIFMFSGVTFTESDFAKLPSCIDIA